MHRLDVLWESKLTRIVGQGSSERTNRVRWRFWLRLAAELGRLWWGFRGLRRLGSGWVGEDLSAQGWTFWRYLAFVFVITSWKSCVYVGSLGVDIASSRRYVLYTRSVAVAGRAFCQGA